MHSQPARENSLRRPAPAALRSALVLALSLGAVLPVLTICLPQSALAQDARGMQTRIPQWLDIPSGALAPALRSLASSANLLLTFTAEQTDGRTTAGLSGRYAAAEALAMLLVGTGLRAVALDNGGYVLRDAPATQAPSAAGSSAVTLSTVRVVENESSADGSAEAGYRSDGVSAVGPWQGRALQDTPYSIAVLSAQLIQNLQATMPDQVYRVVPVAQMGEPSYRNDEPTINLRGFVVYQPYRDGVPGDYLGLGPTTEDVERVEVFSGLSGFLYGPGNVGGMTNYVSKRPTEQRLNRLTAGGNGGSNFYAQGDFGGPIDDAGRVGYRINGIWQGGETAIDGMHIGKRFVSGAADWRVTDALVWKFGASWRDYETKGGPPVWVVAGGVRPAAKTIDPSVSWSQPWKTSYSTKSQFSTQLRWTLSEGVALRAGWLHSDARRERNEGALNRIQADGTYTQRIAGVYAPGDDAFSDKFDNSSGQLFADIRFATGVVTHGLTVGGQYHRFGDAYRLDYPPNVLYPGLTFDRPTYFARPLQPHVDGRDLERDPDQTETSFLVGDDIQFDEHWALLAGLAYSTLKVDESAWADRYDESAVTPNLSLIYKPVDALTTYATYIEALEQGGVAGNDYDGIPVVNAGEVFEPLVSRQVEAGVKWSAGGMLLSTAVFRIEKALQYYDLSHPDAVRFVQDGRQVHRGVEFTAIGRATADFTLLGGLTLLDAKVREQKEDPTLAGKHPTNVAGFIAKLRAEYRLPALPSLTLNGTVIHTGRQYADALNEDRLPAFTLFDAGARYQWSAGSRPLGLRLDVQNLANKAYWTQGVTLGAPRTVLFSVSAEL